jgi:hypothetical protein
MADTDNDWVMGALAQQNYYNPVDQDPWKRYDDEQLVRRIVPDSGMAFGTTTPQEDVYVAPKKAEAAIGALVPQSPLEWSLAGLGPIGKVAGKAGKMGALAAGVYGSLTDEAEAGPLNKLVKGAKAVAGTGAAHKTGTAVEQIGEEAWRPSLSEKYLIDPQREFSPGIYKRPDVIAKEANAIVAPEHPALKELFGVTRDDLYGISQQGTRQGNVAPNIWQPGKIVPSQAATNIMTDANAQRLVDTLTEARKYPGLEKGMIPWYVMDPAFDRLVKLVGVEDAVKQYNDFNSMMTPFSASSDVMKEINRGTMARKMAERGEFETFRKYGGMPAEERPRNFPEIMEETIPHLRHGIHTDAAGRYVETGAHGYDKNTVKIPLYTQASGVPKTGFQTSWAVPDAHFARGVGMADVRLNKEPGKFMAGPEYRTMAPWFRDRVATPLGIESVPAQALTWGAFGPQTGVKTSIGAGKLELISQRIWERAQQMGVDPHWLRDQVLLGKEHAELEDDKRGGMGSTFEQQKTA